MNRNGVNLLTLGPAIVQTPERAMLLEWLETNGLGDFACGTVAGPNTRRHHGLFTAGNVPGGQPMLLLAALDVVLARDRERHDLSCHQYVGALHPEGFRRCVRFSNDPFPKWTFEVPGAALTQRIFMPYGQRCVVCAWQLESPDSAADWRLIVRPLFAYREADALTHANDTVNMSVGGEAGLLSIRPYEGCPEVFLACGDAEVHARGDWYYGFHHPWDVALGREAEEDLFSPCELVFHVAAGPGAALVAGTEKPSESLQDLEKNERQRRASLTLPDLEDDPIASVLAGAADNFVVETSEREPEVLTAFPQPGGGLRQALLAVPGILLCTRRLQEARSLIGTMLHRVLEAPPEETLGDEPLWLIRAGQQYVDHSRDWQFLREELAPAAEALAERYIGGEFRGGYRLAPDGLLCSEGSHGALTWMNARTDDWVVTPRTGKPVEVNALWHHALGLLSRWSRRRERPEAERRFNDLRDLCGRSFRHRFWNESEGCLFDVVDTGAAGAVDRSIRPNQLFAVSLPTDLLDRRMAEGVLAIVERRLLTPCGLRTLSLEDRAFQPRYGCGPVEQAAARHQGSIFPWLIGAYVDAVFRVHGRTPRAYGRAEACLDHLLKEHLSEGCTGQISELFNGAAPHTAQGAFAHAPAVAELIRSYVEVKGRVW